MTTPQELARKVITYVEATCPRPPSNLRWQDYLTGDDDADRPVLLALARGMGITV